MTVPPPKKALPSAKPKTRPPDWTPQSVTLFDFSGRDPLQEHRDCRGCALECQSRARWCAWGKGNASKAFRLPSELSAASSGIEKSAPRFGASRFRGPSSPPFIPARRVSSRDRNQWEKKENASGEARENTVPAVLKRKRRRNCGDSAGSATLADFFSFSLPRPSAAFDENNPLPPASRGDARGAGFLRPSCLSFQCLLHYFAAPYYVSLCRLLWLWPRQRKT